MFAVNSFGNLALKELNHHPDFNQWLAIDGRRFIGQLEMRCDECKKLKESFFYASATVETSRHEPDRTEIHFDCHDCTSDDYNRDFQNHEYSKGVA
jgi:hypothetical protein